MQELILQISNMEDYDLIPFLNAEGKRIPGLPWGPFPIYIRLRVKNNQYTIIGRQSNATRVGLKYKAIYESGIPIREYLQLDDAPIYW